MTIDERRSAEEHAQWMRKGLHDLAQPLTAVLWIAEMSAAENAAHPLLCNLRGEVERALGILRQLQATQANAVPVDLQPSAGEAETESWA